MNKKPFSKVPSSLSLEDLFVQPNTRNAPNWLLTYLDVFVLIVMLVITLITLGDIKTEQQQAVINHPRTMPTCPPIASCPAPTETAQQSVITDNPEANENTTINIPEMKTEVKNPSPEPSIDNAAAEKKLELQLTKTIDEIGLNKAISIKVTQGYAQLEIQDNVLFKSSEASLTASGEALLKRLLPVLKQAVGLILIEGHTDNIPIKTAQFPSNWELGSARATSVLHFLVSQQLNSSHLRALTYADTMPIANNSTAEGREKNRRVNILIKLSEH